MAWSHPARLLPQHLVVPKPLVVSIIPLRNLHPHPHPRWHASLAAEMRLLIVMLPRRRAGSGDRELLVHLLVLLVFFIDQYYYWCCSSIDIGVGVDLPSINTLLILMFVLVEAEILKISVFGLFHIEYCRPQYILALTIYLYLVQYVP